MTAVHSRYVTAVWDDGAAAGRGAGVPASTVHPLAVPAGGDAKIVLSILDRSTGVATDTTDAVITWSLRYASGELACVARLAVLGDPGEGTVVIASADTADLEPGRYSYDVWMTRDGAQQQIVARSVWDVQRSNYTGDGEYSPDLQAPEPPIAYPGVYALPSGSVVGQVVKITAALTASYASNSSASDEAVGIIIAKLTATTGRVALITVVGGLTGLTPGAAQYLGVDGAVTETPPSEDGTFVQYLGIATSATEIAFHPSAAHLATKGYVDTADALKAPLASPTFTGTPAAPTASLGTDTTQLATTGFVAAAIVAIKDGVSSAYDTLAEIATELGALASSIAGKLSLSGGTLTGQVVGDRGTFAYSATPTLDVSTHANWDLTDDLDGNMAVTLSNGVTGMCGTIAVRQDGTGSRTFSLTATGATAVSMGGSIASGADKYSMVVYEFRTVDGNLVCFWHAIAGT